MFSNICILGRNIPVYSLAAAIGIFAAVFYMKAMVRRPHYADLDRDLELAFVYALLGTAIGAKLLYLVIEFPDIVSDISSLGWTRTLYKYTLGGFVFYGGMIGCFSAIYFYCVKAKISFAHTMQLMLPAFPLAHAFARCGCFMTGCCYGKETGSAISVVYTESQYAPNGTPLVPIQMIEAVYVFVIFILLYMAAKRTVSGEIMLGSYLLLYGTGRAAFELFRGDAYRGFIGFVSVSQIISLLCICVGAGIILKQRIDKNDLWYNN